MADDDSSAKKRESHYNQQRSSLRSERSAHTTSRPQSRPHSRPVNAPIRPQVDAFTLQHAGQHDSGPSSPSPAPYVPRTPSGRQSPIRNERTADSRGTWGINNLLSHDLLQRSKGIDSPPPLQVTDGSWLSRYSSAPEHHSTQSEELRHQSTTRASHRQQLQRTGGRITPASILDITALPNLGDKRETISKAAYSSVLTELYAASYLIFFSILGTLARIGLQSLTFYPGTPVTVSLIWPNVAGTFIIGFLIQDQRLFRAEWGMPPVTPPPPERTPGAPEGDEEVGRPETIYQTARTTHNKVKKTIPLYIGLTTGFCGSFTSFSGFMRDVFISFVNAFPAPIDYSGMPTNSGQNFQRNSGYSFMAGLAVILLTLSLSHTAFRVGAHLSSLLEPYTPTISFRFTRYALDPFVVLIGWASWLGAVFMAIWPPDRPEGPLSRGSWSNEVWRGQAIFACAFAPLGCLLRYYLSLILNPLAPCFPLGTFVVNIFGTAVIGMAYDLQHVPIRSFGPGGGRVGCQVLQGLMDGFCGALTTVSTWISELDLLKRKHAYLYGFTSVSVGILLLLVIMGSVKWTIGWTAVACVT